VVQKKNLSKPYVEDTSCHCKRFKRTHRLLLVIGARVVTASRSVGGAAADLGLKLGQLLGLLLLGLAQTACGSGVAALLGSRGTSRLQGCQKQWNVVETYESDLGSLLGGASLGGLRGAALRGAALLRGLGGPGGLCGSGRGLLRSAGSGCAALLGSGLLRRGGLLAALGRSGLGSTAGRGLLGSRGGGSSGLPGSVLGLLRSGESELGLALASGQRSGHVGRPVLRRLLHTLRAAAVLAIVVAKLTREVIRVAVAKFIVPDT
jgi:hypothetical protein